jgi:arginine/serine-rich splicing factor 7
MSSSDKNNVVYIRGFSRRASREDIKDIFRKYGRIKDVQLKNGFAFVHFDDYYDAEESVDALNGKNVDGYRLTVEPAGRDWRKNRNNDRERRGPSSDDKCYNCGKRGHWKNECKDPVKSRYSRSRSRRRSSSSSSADRKKSKKRRHSSSSSSDRDRRRKRKDKDRKRKRSESSSKAK